MKEEHVQESKADKIEIKISDYRFPFKRKWHDFGRLSQFCRGCSWIPPILFDFLQQQIGPQRSFFVRNCAFSNNCTTHNTQKSPRTGLSQCWSQVFKIMLLNHAFKSILHTLQTFVIYLVTLIRLLMEAISLYLFLTAKS